MLDRRAFLAATLAAPLAAMLPDAQPEITYHWFPTPLQFKDDPRHLSIYRTEFSKSHPNLWIATPRDVQYHITHIEC